jgi:hypothetical protein
MLLRVSIFAASVLAAGSVQAATPVIVELFTSEGCSSCPPADRLLSRLPGAFSDIEVIPLSEHVDYWNQLGWQDRFSAPLYSMRQQDYGRLFRLESVYTPEMVVNGEAEFNGTDENRAQQEIRKAAQNPRADLDISMQSREVVHLKAEHLPRGTRAADVFLVITETNLETAVRAGENGGRRLRHTGVVRSLSNVGRVDSRNAPTFSADAKLNLNPDWKLENVKLVLFVQDRSNRRIVGVATLRP